MKFTYQLDKLQSIAQNIIDNVNSKTLLFYGNMGVGKTTLIKEIAMLLGVTDVS